MTILNNIDEYIKDSLINGKVCRFDKTVINYFIQPISAPIQDTQKQEYYSIIANAANIWNNYAPVRLIQTETANNADIVIVWTKVGIKFEGMCKFPSIIASTIKKVTIEIGLPNPHSTKIINNSTILHTTMHEFGHAMGLGHGVDENDLMFVPHTKTLNKPSDNDLFVLKTLYNNQIGTQFSNLQK